MGFVKNVSIFSAVIVAVLFMKPEYQRALKKGKDHVIWPAYCNLRYCYDQVSLCRQDENCKAATDCNLGCILNNTEERIAACGYTCEMTYGYDNSYFVDVLDCMVEHQCFTPYPDDGKCFGTDKDAVQSIKDLNQLKGHWWAISGVNCGQNDTFPGGYDWYPCQRDRFMINEHGQWMNNVTYCDGRDSVCHSDMIVTMANISLPKPGVIAVSYLDAPLAPQEETWRIVGYEDDTFILVFWCGRIPIMNYNGVLIFAREPVGRQVPREGLIPPHVEKKFREITAKHGINYDEMCETDNSKCADV